MASLKWINGKPYVKARIDGKEFLRRIKVDTRLEAAKFVRRLNKSVKNEKLVMLGEILPSREHRKPLTPTFNDVIGQYLDFVEETQQSHTYNSKVSRYKVHWLPHFDGVSLSEITGPDIERIKADFKRLGYSTVTIYNALKDLKAAFQWAIDSGLFAGENPVKALPSITNRKIAVLNDEQASHFLECCSAAYYPIAATVLMTGLRKGEILDLRWTDLDFNRMVMEVRSDASHKNVHGREIPIREDLVEILKSLPTTSVFVFPGADGKSKRTDIKRCHETARVKAGYPHLRFHDLRHTFASILICHGFDLSTVSQMLGHSSDRLTRRIYFHVIPNHAKHVIDNHPLKLSRCDTGVKTGYQTKTPTLGSGRKCI